MKISLPGLVSAALLALVGSAANAAVPYAADTFVRSDIVIDPTPESFSVCHGGTCTLVSPVRLDAAQWAQIAAIFPSPAHDAGEERSRIAEAIARLETLVGALTDTADDRAENQKGRDWRGQMDCIDESTNSTTYLRILARAGLLRWHRVEARVTRGFFILGWPHTTAVVSEVAGGTKWAVDSWFFENGKAPVIVPLELWKSGWRPARTPVSAATSK